MASNPLGVLALAAALLGGGAVAGCGSTNGGPTASPLDASPRDAVGDATTGDVTPGDVSMGDVPGDVTVGDVPGDAGAGDDANDADGATSGAYGQPCTVGDDTTCDTGLFCLQGPAMGPVGFCTHTCPPTSSTRCAGTPPRTAAYCVVTDVNAQGDKACAFVCRVGTTMYPCPGVLRCQSTQEPPGSGQYLCLP